MSKVNKRKVVTFQLVNRSLEDPNNADPNASEHVLVPIHIGEDVDPALVEQLQKQMTPEARVQHQKKHKKQDGRKGIGARYNKIFGEDLPDDGTDYSKFFKAIDEENDDGVFVAPDGSVHDLRKKDVEDVDLLVNKLGITPDMFGTEADKSLPKLIDDTANPLASGIDPDVLLAMDDENALPLDDDFISKALDLEAEEDFDYDEEDDYDSVDDYDMDGNRVKKTMSRVSATPSHMSHISHRSHAMDLQEQRVDYIIENVFREEEEGSEDEHREDQKPTNWAEIAEDLKQFEGKITLNPVPKPQPQPESTEQQPEPVPVPEEEEAEEEEEEFVPKPIPLDIRSVTDLASTTSNLPSKVQDISKRKKKVKKVEEEEKVEAPIPPEFAPKPGETKEEAKARKKAIKEYQRQKRAMKKERKQKFAQATKKVHKSIAAAGASRGARVYNLD